MRRKRAVFAIHDTTTYRNLKPISEALPDHVSVEYLLLDDLFDEALGVSRDELVPFRDATEYVRTAVFESINHRNRPGSLSIEAFQRILEDRLSPHLVYDLRSYWDDADPDLLVCGHDRLPFVKHLIRMCHNQNVPSAVIQHGVQNLRPVASDSQLVNYLRPSTDPLVPEIEMAKRWLFYRYGTFIFCNPYLDTVYTMGDFFTKEITSLRKGFPSLGKTEVVTAGYPEYQLGDIDHFSPSVENAIFLSGWEYEAGEWGPEVEQSIADRLQRFAEVNDIELTIRPHPKDSPDKIERFYSHFRISDVEDLDTDIGRHDSILTVYSTAIMLGVAKGKVCGVIDVGYEQSRFAPFEDAHLLDITVSNLEVHDRAKERSRRTQEQYLRQYCFIPGLYSDSNHETPAEFISGHLSAMLERSLFSE